MPDRLNLTSTDGVVVILKTVFHFLPTLRCTQVFDPVGAVTTTVNLRFFATLTLRVSLIVGTTTTGAVSIIGAGSGVGCGVGAMIAPGVMTSGVPVTKTSTGCGVDDGVAHTGVAHSSEANGLITPSPYRLIE